MLVCELDENYMQAEAILSLITKLVIEYVTSYEQKNAEVSYIHHGFIISLISILLQLMLKSEKMSVILNQLLPCGQLLFLNHKLQAQLEKQVEKALALK